MGGFCNSIGIDTTPRVENNKQVPQKTDIMGQPHYLAYINEEEGQLLKDLGGSGIPGPGGIPAYPPTSQSGAGANVAPSSSGGSSAAKRRRKKKAKAAAARAAKALADQQKIDAAAKADDKPSGVGAGNTLSDGSTSLGSVSQTGQYAGDGYEWKQNDNTNALTRVYTGANANAGLGNDVVMGGTSNNNVKEVIANISLNEGTAFAGSAASATDGDLLNLFTEGNFGASDSYADQVGAVDYTTSVVYDSTATGAANTALRDAREAAAAAQAEKEAAAAALKAQQEALSLPVGGPGTFAPGALPAAPIEPINYAVSQGEAGRGGPDSAAPTFTYQPGVDPQMEMLVSLKNSGVQLTPSEYLKVSEYENERGLNTSSPTSTVATTPEIQVAGPMQLASSADFAMPGTAQAAYATSGAPVEVGGEFDPRNILPTSEQMAEFEGTAQEPVDLTPEPGALYQNIIGYGEVDTPGERFGQYINDLGSKSGQGFIEGPVQQGATGLALYADEIIENMKGAFSPTGPNAPYLGYDPILSNQGFGPGQVDPALAQAAAAIRDQNAAQAAAANQVTGVSDFVRSNIVEPLQPVADYFEGEMSPQMRERVEKYTTVDPNTTIKDLLTGDVKSISGETITRDIPALIVRGGEDLYDVVLDVVTGKAGFKGLATVFGLSAGEGAGSSNEEVQQRITAGISDGTVDVESLANSKYGGDKTLAEQAIRDAATEVSLATAGPVAGAGDAALAFGLGYTGIPGLVGKLPGVAQAPFKLGGASVSGGLTESGEQVGTNLAYNVATGQNLPLSMGVVAQGIQGGLGQGISSTGNIVGSTLDMGKTVNPNPDVFVPTGPKQGQPAQSTVPTSYTETEDPEVSRDITSSEALMAGNEIILDENIVFDGDKKTMSNTETGFTVKLGPDATLKGDEAAKVSQGIVPEGATEVTGAASLERTPPSGIETSLLDNQIIENLKNTPGNLTIVPQPDDTVKNLAATPGNLTAVPQPEDTSGIAAAQTPPNVDRVMQVLQNARGQQVQGSGKVVSKTGIQSLYDAGLVSEGALSNPVIANVETANLVALGPDAIVAKMNDNQAQDNNPNQEEALEKDGYAEIKAALDAAEPPNTATLSDAIDIVNNDGKVSTSYIQRKLGIPYSQAADFVNQMEDQGLVSAQDYIGRRTINTDAVTMAAASNQSTEAQDNNPNQDYIDEGLKDGTKSKGVFSNDLEAKKKAIQKNIGDEAAEAYEVAVKSQFNPNQDVAAEVVLNDADAVAAVPFTSKRTDTGADTEATATPTFKSTRGTDTDTDVAAVVEVADDTADDTTKVEVADDTAAEPETLENTEVEVETKPKVEVETKPKVETDTTTDVDTTTLITTDQPPEDDEEVIVELEDDVEVDPPIEEPPIVLIPPVTKTDDKGNKITECPEGYVEVQTPDGIMCEKITTTSTTTGRRTYGVGRTATTGLSGNVGRQKPRSRTRTRTSTSTSRVKPTTRKA